jgi:RHS repeat-associated protein
VDTKSSGSSPVVSLPKGGASVKGIGETFQPDLFSGTGNYSIPLAISPGRNGFGPKISLQYSSGNGNGPFGLGWSVSIPRITRKTEKGLPRYGGSDVFVLSGAEDLVPVAVVPSPTGTVITRYRPRTEGVFARIEKWDELDSAHNVTDTHWRVTSKDNLTSIYGQTTGARLADPEKRERIYEWLLEETFDAKGNHILYEYACEDPDLSRNIIGEANRSHAGQRYIRRIYFGNTPTSLPAADHVGPTRRGRHYSFEAVFDYGDPVHTAAPPYPTPGAAQELTTNQWFVRGDPFSSYRAAFEIRTLRRCARVLMFHHFTELGGTQLVKATNFEYDNDANTRLSLLSSVRVEGYARQGAGYSTADMPPITFKYSAFKPEQQRYASVAAIGNDLPARSLADRNYSVVDLFGDGLPDILETIPGTFKHWRNLGNGTLDRAHVQHGPIPSVALSQPGVALGDIAGDGLADLLVQTQPMSGFFEATATGEWQTFKSFDSFPSVGLADPNVRLIDLTGDGRSDILMSSDHHFVWFECLGEDGYGGPQLIERVHNLNDFPDVYFDAPSGRVRLADMNGDGLADIVLLHNGRVDYWPSLGHGQFGKRITMSNTPLLELNFDPKRLFLCDLDGSGCADLVYVDFDRVHFWFNQSGNGWSQTQTILGTPATSDLDSIQFVDFLGTGTATLLWSYDYDFQPGGNYKVLDFCGGTKPYLLTEMSNNMGATTRVQFAPSTKFYLEDKHHGRPWVTNLPFPVHVVDKIEVIDHVSRTKLVTSFKYHHGCFDGSEREFRGFGRVDQIDTETFDDFTGGGLHQDSGLFDNGSTSHHVPPVETRTWFHTGVAQADGFTAEFYGGDVDAFRRGDHDLPPGAPQEALRALRGALIRKEVYGRDGTARSEHPYLVAENRYRVRLLQAGIDDRHRVYLTSQAEGLSYHYERQPADPRTVHEFNTVDDFGNVTDSVAIAYPRRRVPVDLPEQGVLTAVYTRTDFINKVDDPGFHYVGVPFQTRNYEVRGLNWPTTDRRLALTAADIAPILASPGDFLPYEFEWSGPAATPAKRLIEWNRSYFRKDTAAERLDISIDAVGNPVRTLADRLPLGSIESLALPYEAYRAVFTKDLIAATYGSRAVTDTLLKGGYHQESDQPNYWWLPSGQQSFNRRKGYVAEKASDPFGNVSEFEYDAYGLITKEVRDPLQGRARAVGNYRVVQPHLLTDANGNRSAVRFDPLGLVAMTFVMGKEGDDDGDHFDESATEMSTLDDPTTRFEYDIMANFGDPRHRQPNFVKASVREKHRDPNARWQVAYSYFDGFGRDIQKKIQAEPGPVEGVHTDPRWVGTGWTIFNNKGKPVQKYEPFFSKDHAFEFAKRVGTSSILFYDPMERAVATLGANHSYTKIVFDPWRQESWDANDTVDRADPKEDPDVGTFFRRIPDHQYLPTWHTLRANPTLALQRWPDVDPLSGESLPFNAGIRTNEAAAARATETHANTPGRVYLDTLGRGFLTIAHNRFERDHAVVEEHYSTRVKLDVEGNQRALTDAKHRIAMRYDYDMAGRRIHQASMESGERWVLDDAAGNPMCAWNSRDYQFRTEYDQLRRPVRLLVAGADPADPAREILFKSIVYGESHPEAEKLNLRGKPFAQFDGAGVVMNVATNPDTNERESHDFKGNLLRSSRRLARQYQQRMDWASLEPLLRVPALDLAALESSLAPLLEAETFTTSTTYDGLNRPATITSPDSSVIRPTYNEANLLESVTASLRGASATTVFVANIDYDAKGRRTLIGYGNGVQTDYEYDPQTSRLTHLSTTGGLQELRYTYDPSGNVTHIGDDARPTICFNGQVVLPTNDYVYDAVYRLIGATGREHIGQAARPATTYNDPTRVNLPHPHDGQAMRRYSETYQYDAVGNFLFQNHQAVNGTWSRSFHYDEPGLIDPAENSNRLSKTITGTSTESYGYDAAGGRQGHITAMPHLAEMSWDFEDQLAMTKRQAVDAEDVDGGHRHGERTFYVYDAAGQRVRKVTETQNSKRRTERIYVGAFEVYREYAADGTTRKLERESLHILDNKRRICLVETKTIDAGPPTGSVPYTLQRYTLGNHLESAALELDHLGHVTSYEEYYPYGSTSYQGVRTDIEVPLKRYRYSAKERDEETGLYYYGARYYAAWLGRWVSCDPLGLADAVNLYLFVKANPVVLTDPDGRSTEGTPPPDPGPDAPPPSNLPPDETVVSRVVGKAGDRSFYTVVDWRRHAIEVEEGGKVLNQVGERMAEIEHKGLAQSTGGANAKYGDGAYAYADEAGAKGLATAQQRPYAEFKVAPDTVVEDVTVDRGGGNRVTYSILKAPEGQNVELTEVTWKNVSRQQAAGFIQRAREIIAREAPAGSQDSEVFQPMKNPGWRAGLWSYMKNMTGVKAIGILGGVFAVYDISSKTLHTAEKKGAEAGAMQFTKTTLQHSYGILWFSLALYLGGGILAVGALGPLATPVVAVCVAVGVVYYGTKATNQMIANAFPGLE